MKFCTHPLTVLPAFSLVLKTHIPGFVLFCFAPPSPPPLIFILPRGGSEKGPFTLSCYISSFSIPHKALKLGFRIPSHSLSPSFFLFLPLSFFFYSFLSFPLSSSLPFSSSLLSVAFPVSFASLLLPPQISLKLHYSERVLSFLSPQGSHLQASANQTYFPKPQIQQNIR